MNLKELDELNNLVAREVNKAEESLQQQLPKPKFTWEVRHADFNNADCYHIRLEVATPNGDKTACVQFYISFEFIWDQGPSVLRSELKALVDKMLSNECTAVFTI